MEDKQEPLHEKARKFLEKNMEQTALNRDLEDRIKVLNENNNKLVRHASCASNSIVLL